MGSQNQFVMEVVAGIGGCGVVGFPGMQHKTGGFVILRGDEIGVRGNDDPFQAFVRSDSPQGFCQLQAAVSTAFVFLTDSVVANLDMVGKVPGVPCHEA